MGFPSALRNAVNYQPDYVLSFLKNEFHKMPRQIDYLRQLLGYEYETNEPFDKSLNVLCAYHFYIIELADCFFRDYIEMLDSKRFVLKYPEIMFTHQSKNGRAEKE